MVLLAPELGTLMGRPHDVALPPGGNLGGGNGGLCSPVFRNETMHTICWIGPFNCCNVSAVVLPVPSPGPVLGQPIDAILHFPGGEGLEAFPGVIFSGDRGCSPSALLSYLTIQKQVPILLHPSPLIVVGVHDVLRPSRQSSG